MPTARPILDFINWFNSIDFSNQERRNRYIRMLERIEEISIQEYYRTPPVFRDPEAYRKSLRLLNFLIALFRND